MARDIAIEFTEEKYCTRKEANNIMHGVVTDKMWNNIVNYRNSFNVNVNLKDAEGDVLHICFYPTLSSKCNQIENKFSIILKEYNDLSDVTGDRQHFRLTAFVNALAKVATKNEYSIDEARIKKIIASENPYDDDENHLLNYTYALNYIEEKYVNNIDELFVNGLLGVLTESRDLTSLYRTEDLVDSDYRSLVGKFYNAAPGVKIASMMNDFYAFVFESKISPINKALISYFYINYVRPFKKYNEEMALLIAKAILAHESLGEAAVIMPLEELLLEKGETNRKVILDVVSDNDLTYFLSPSIFFLERPLAESLSTLSDYSIHSLRSDFYKEDEVVEDEEDVKEEPVVVEEAPKEEVKVEEKVEELPKEEEPEFVELFPEVDDVKAEEKVEEVSPEAIEDVEDESEDEEKDDAYPELAISSIPNKISEKEASRLEQHLLELDVRLNRKQAHFYARHCTLGMYYTIEQYKKMEKVVYETARTSMELFVELAYYKREKIGKKFFYTPIKRK